MCCCMWSKRRGQSTVPCTAAVSDGIGEHVGDPIALVHDVQHRAAAQGAGVVRLPTGRGIERGPVEVDPTAVVGEVHDGGLEVAQVGVGVVEADGHERIVGGMAGTAKVDRRVSA